MGGAGGVAARSASRNGGWRRRVAAELGCRSGILARLISCWSANSGRRGGFRATLGWRCGRVSAGGFVWGRQLIGCRGGSVGSSACYARGIPVGSADRMSAPRVRLAFRHTSAAACRARAPTGRAGRAGQVARGIARRRPVGECDTRGPHLVWHLTIRLLKSFKRPGQPGSMRM